VAVKAGWGHGRAVARSARRECAQYICVLIARREVRLPAGIEVLSLVVANCFSIANPSGPAHSYLPSQPFAPRAQG